jgi:hypothetical protein
MSSTPTGRSADIQRLVTAGYSLEIRSNHLLMHDVPYVNEVKEVCRGTLVAPLTLTGTVTTAPGDHVVHFIGMTPCTWQGIPLSGLQHAGASELAPGLRVDMGFSNKPSTPFPDFEQKLLHYMHLLTPQAVEIDPTATAKNNKLLVDDSDQSVFCYPDTGSARAGITAISAKLEQHRVGIIGAGGTGSYILDLLAKTSVARIDVFDGDRLLTHNAFRAPGATARQDLDGRPFKASHFCGKYAAMRSEIRPFDVYITSANLHLLDDCTFVFVCIDSGPARRLIVDHFLARGIPFIDCGLGMLVNDQQQAIFGTVRATLVTLERADTAMNYLSFADDEPGDDVYASNIQVAELNAMNACMAVMRFKKHIGFYVDLRGDTQWTFSTSSNTMTGDAEQ